MGRLMRGRGGTGSPRSERALQVNVLLMETCARRPEARPSPSSPRPSPGAPLLPFRTHAPRPGLPSLLGLPFVLYPFITVPKRPISELGDLGSTATRATRALLWLSGCPWQERIFPERPTRFWGLRPPLRKPPWPDFFPSSGISKHTSLPCLAHSSSFLTPIPE